MPADRHYGETFLGLYQNPFYVGFELVERLLYVWHVKTR